MRFLFGVLVGYSMRGKETRVILGLAALAFILYILLTCVALPAVALLALGLDVQHERQSRPAKTRVPALKGLSYEEAETKLHASNLNIRLLATRYDLPLQPGLIIDQVPQPGEEVVFGYPVGITITGGDSHTLPFRTIPSARYRNQTGMLRAPPDVQRSQLQLSKLMTHQR